MRKSAVICLALLLLLPLAGCTPYAPDNPDRIDRPANGALLIEGSWKVVGRIGSDNAESDETGAVNGIIGEEIGISASALAFAGDNWSNVGYKVKRVDIQEYFLHRSAGKSEEIGLQRGDALVYTAYSGDKFLCEFIITSDNAMIANINDQYYRMKKLSDKFDAAGKAAFENMKPSASAETAAEDRLLRSGLLLGVRTPVKTEDGIGDYTYRTYWISSVNRAVGPVLSTKDIYLPRMDGFWKLSVEKRMGSEGVEDVPVASMVPKKGVKMPVAATKDNSNILDNYSKRVETRLRSAIIYVGNDYACVENTVRNPEPNASAAAFIKTLRTLPVDNLSNANGVKIDDLVGENGIMALENAVADIMKNSAGSVAAGQDENGLRESFALYRKMGHWFFKGRLNLNSTGQLPYVDFNINLIPPANMVAYDVLQVPWTEIKDRLPQAVDCYTSPNRDLAVILTRNAIFLYGINGKSLSEKPLAKLALAEGSSVVMAEWAVGNYVTAWENSFVKNNETRREKSM